MRKKVKRKKNHHLNRLKTRKAGSSWFKLVYFDIFLLILKSASNLNGNLNCSKELEHYAS